MNRRRFVALLLLLSFVAAAWLYVAARDPWPDVQDVRVPRAEAAHTARVLASTIALLDRTHGAPGRPYSRSSYAKGHGCLRATVSVPELPVGLRHGVLAGPAEYAAWVRFSNGSERLQSDQDRDARGLALKLMGVPGDKLLAAEKAEQTQDFVLSDSSRAAVPDVAAYAGLIDHVSRGSRYGWFFDDWSWKPWRWRVRELWLATRAAAGPPASLLQTRYYSQTPYRLGPEQIVKYEARPCERTRPPRRDRTESMLREGLREELSLGDACFELLVQLQVPGRNMPVEDATVEWSEADSPFLPVARIVIPKQDFESPEQDRFCEALSFTPWHALPAHEPVGGLNRLRRAVYQEVSRYRHARSGSPRGEPRGSCLDLIAQSCVEPTPGPASAATGAAPASQVAPSPVATAEPKPRRSRTATAPPPIAEPPAAEPPAAEPPAHEPPAAGRQLQSHRPKRHPACPTDHPPPRRASHDRAPLPIAAMMCAAGGGAP